MGYVLLVLLLVAVAVHAKDYCQYKCSNGANNLACKNSEKPASDCNGFKQLTLGSSEQQLVVGEHNLYRSMVAKGKAKNGKGEYLPSAKNMNELVWDDELAYLSYLNVLQCKMHHDACRDTETHNGQNLHITWTTATSSISQVIKNGVKAWYNEIKNIKLSEISKLIGGSGAKIGHFTQLIWSNTTRVGCAIGNYKDRDYNAYLLACDYVNGNIIGSSIYDAGKICESCKTCTKLGLCKA